MSKEPAGLRERNREERQNAILDAARDLVVEIGYDAMTMDALAARAGVTKPTLYAHFPNKEAIAVGSILRRLRIALAYIRDQDPSVSPLTRLEAQFRWALISKFIQCSVPYGNAPTAVFRNHPEYLDLFTELVDRQRTLIEEGQRVGEINPDLNARAVVQAFLSVLRDPESVELVRSGQVPGEALVQTLLTLLIKPLRREP